MQIGYNTNGFGFHHLDDALGIIAETGFRCVALTPDVHHLNPFLTSSADVASLKRRLADLNLSCVIEAGSRYILDPRRKHRPTLLDDRPQPRVDFLKRCMDLAVALGAGCVSTWSGARPAEGHHADLGDKALFEILALQWQRCCDALAGSEIPLALEPEPGFLVATCEDYERLCGLMTQSIPLTLDVGHCVCEGGLTPQAAIIKHAKALVNVQLDDMRPRVHDHLMFGTGDVDFAAVFAALNSIDYRGPACVELSSASRNAVETAKASMVFLQRFIHEG